ncbi:hypothetical protein E4U43_002488 [Claviceps pusilla]|uniref:Uncharacterized protein n=1 Tax=Claviceps pusilla TaxID=123648 RepID=A0A9P7N8A6_9HYPO|nr:hypothetical protein E4U43_002488 [Claviceps pusilla]
MLLCGWNWRVALLVFEEDYAFMRASCHQTEYHPIYATLIGTSGTDTMLVKLVEATFQQAQWRSAVDKGRFAFPAGQNTKA